MLERGKLRPRAFFVTSGVGIDSEQANAFDLALCDAGIGECNLVEVSSILPAAAVETEREREKLTPGEITFCVLSRADGKSGEVVGAGVGYGWIGGWREGERQEEERDFGIICEHHGHFPTAFLNKKIEEKLHKMAAIRGKKIAGTKLEAKAVEVADGKFGSVVVALVFVF